VEVQSQKFVTLSSIKRKRTHQIRDILDRVGVKLTQLFGCDEIVSFSKAERNETQVIYKTILDHKDSDTYFSWNVPKGLEIDLNVPHAVQSTRARTAPERLKPTEEPKRLRNARKNPSNETVLAKRQRLCLASQPADRYATESDDEAPLSQLSEAGACDLMALSGPVDPDVAVDLVAPPCDVPVVQAMPIRAYYEAMPPDPVMVAKIEKLKAENDRLKAMDDVKNQLIAVQERQIVAYRACFAAL